MSLTDFKPREFARMVLKWMGVLNPGRYLKTQAQVEATRKRSEAAKLGWTRRKAATFKAPPLP